MLKLEFDDFSCFFGAGLEGAFLGGFFGGCCEKWVSAHDAGMFHGAVRADGHFDANGPCTSNPTCVCRKLDSAILMVKAAKDRS